MVHLDCNSGNTLSRILINCWNLPDLDVQTSFVAIIVGNLIVLTITGILFYGTIKQKCSYLWLWVAMNILNVGFLFEIFSKYMFRYHFGIADFADFEINCQAGGSHDVRLIINAVPHSISNGMKVV